MIWLWIIGAALLTTAGLFWLGRVAPKTRTFAAAAILLGLTGYAIQGNPSLGGKPVERVRDTPGFGEKLTDNQAGMADRFGPAAQWIGMSDGFLRTGKTEMAAVTLQKGLARYPDNVDLWVGLGNALVAHGGGMMSAASRLAFEEASKRDPSHPAPPFFAGLALAQSGDLTGAERVWSALLANSPADAPWRADLSRRLTELRNALGTETNAETSPVQP